MVENIGAADGHCFISRDDAFYGRRAAGHMQRAYSRPVPAKTGGYGKAGSWGQGLPRHHAFFALAISTTGTSCATCRPAGTFPLSCVRYGYEVFKAAAITALIDRVSQGVGCLAQRAGRPEKPLRERRFETGAPLVLTDPGRLPPRLVASAKKVYTDSGCHAKKTRPRLMARSFPR